MSPSPHSLSSSTSRSTLRQSPFGPCHMPADPYPLCCLPLPSLRLLRPVLALVLPHPPPAPVLIIRNPPFHPHYPPPPLRPALPPPLGPWALRGLVLRAPPLLPRSALHPDLLRLRDLPPPLHTGTVAVVLLRWICVPSFSARLSLPPLLPGPLLPASPLLVRLLPWLPVQVFQSPPLGLLPRTLGPPPPLLGPPPPPPSIPWPSPTPLPALRSPPSRRSWRR